MREEKKKKNLSTPKVMLRWFLQCRELHGIRDGVLLGRYYIFLLKIKVLVLPFVYKTRETQQDREYVYHTFARSGHSLGSCDRIFQRRQSLLQGHQLFCACSCLGLGSWRNFLRSVCRNDKGFSTDWYFVSRIVSSSILVRSSSREMALRYCYSGYIALICLYINVSMSFSFFI